MKKVNVAIAGTGFGARTIVPCFKSLEQVNLVAICGGRDKDKTRDIAQKYGIPVFDADFSEICHMDLIDLIAIASPHQFHYEMVDQALDAHKHTLCEKPLALTAAEIKRIITKSRNDDRLHLVNHQLRFHPAIRRIRELICSGILGTPYQVNIAYQTDRYADPELTWQWWFEPRLGGGMVIAMGSHLVDLVQFWFGDNVATVYAHLDPVLHYLPTINGARRRVKAESAFCCHLGLKNGVWATISCTAVAFQESRMEVSIFGTLGELQFRTPNELHQYTLKNGVKKVRVLFSNESYDTTRHGSYFHYSFSLFAKSLVAALNTGDITSIADATTFEDYWYKHSVFNAMKRSHQEKKAITLR